MSLELANHKTSSSAKKIDSNSINTLRISVQGGKCGIQIGTAEDRQIKVESYAPVNTSTNVVQFNDYCQFDSWYVEIVVPVEENNSQVNVYVPNEIFERIIVAVEDGDIFISRSVSTEVVKCFVESGNVKCSADFRSLRIIADDGNIEVNAHLKNNASLYVSSMRGSIKAKIYEVKRLMANITAYDGMVQEKSNDVETGYELRGQFLTMHGDINMIANAN